jgi:hypothetical protein
MADYLKRRGGFWWFQRRVPDELAAFDNRPGGIVQKSTGIRIVDDPRKVAAIKWVAGYNGALEADWRALADSGSAHAVAESQAAMRAATAMHISAPDPTVQRTIAELLARIKQLEGRTDDRASGLAVLDQVGKPVATFKQCAEKYIDAHKTKWAERVTQSWQNTLARYAFPILGDVSVAEINGNGVGTELILKVVEPIWSKKNATASQVRGRIESVLDWATARGCREGANPARWRGHLDKLLAAKNKNQHHAALPFVELPTFMRKLRAESGTAAQALEFLVLTAVRTNEALGAKRSEINRKERMWTIPAARMKAGKEHRVPLSDAALKIIDAAPKGDVFVPEFSR